MKACVFIDGNNLYHNLKASGISPNQIDLVKLSAFVSSKYTCTVIKIYYYNSLPDIKENQNTYFKHLSYLENLRKSTVIVKTRKLQKKSIQEIKSHARILDSLCSSCRQKISRVSPVREKGIDTMIAIDMVRAALIDRECDYCILVSGDADFIPAMDLIAAHGKQAVSAALAKGYSYELRRTHGWFIIDVKDIHNSCLKQ